MKTYTGLIETLKPNQIFVFGSNTQGRHGKGSALKARLQFGAIYGQARGMQGQSYAIVTKDLTKERHPSISRACIVNEVALLYSYAKSFPELEFVVAYSGVGFNLSGYTPEQMAEMFAQSTIPRNIVFEEQFSRLVKKYL